MRMTDINSIAVDAATINGLNSDKLFTYSSSIKPGSWKEFGYAYHSLNEEAALYGPMLAVGLETNSYRMTLQGDAYLKSFAIGMFDDIKKTKNIRTVFFREDLPPSDGKTYGYKDGNWVEIASPTSEES